MRCGIVNIVEIELCAEFRVARAREKVKAAVIAQELVAKLNNARNRRENKNIVKSAACERS